MQLRQELESICNASGKPHEFVDDQVRAIEQLKQKYAHEIELHEAADRRAPYHNCFMYALGLPQDPILKWWQLGKVPGVKFVERLIESGILKPVSNASGAPDRTILIYSDDTGRPVRAGIKLGDKVISKWGCGYSHTWKHPRLEAPASYGDAVTLYQPAEHAALVKEYAAFAQAQTGTDA